MRKLLALVTLFALPLVANCAVHQDAAPSQSGPAEAGLSLKMSASPDSLFQDGNQSSRIAVTAFDSAGHAIAANVRLSVSPFNFGTLSAATITTRADAANPVIVTYIPPAANTGNARTVTIQGTMIGSDASAGSTNQVSVFVNPAASIASTAPTASFVVSPALVTSGRAATFDASSSCGGQLVGGACTSTSALTNFTWNFGDNTTAVGSIVGHTYVANGNFTVTLTVTNDQGRQATMSQLVSVSTVAAPTADFVFSPNTIHPGDVVNFNATASKAAPGHNIVRYDWNFGEGTTTSTTAPTATNKYAVVNTYKATLTITDDVGQTATKEVDVAVVP
ncbi:MAG TPA: PKD domain-containing protein [Vicinamibacterales bacterium]|nr:PKD domain-containing protein [Vicinamibacterales bacterium]